MTAVQFRIVPCFHWLETYKKRSGTSDRGKDYEWLLCAFYSLNFTTSPQITDFELFTNNEFFGDFDDITLRAKFSNGRVETFLLQLKHSEKTKALALNSLTSASGDFTLVKYIKSYENMISLGNFRFILYLNKTANFKDKTKLTLEGQEVYIRQHSCVGETLLNTSKSRSCSVFTFEAVSESTRNFFENFYLYVNQQNDSNLKQSISDLLKTSLHCDIYTTFVEYIRTWWAGNFKLTKYDVVAKLAELVLSPMIKTLSSEESNEKTKLIEDAVFKFDVTLVEGRYGKRIAKIWSKLDENFDVKTASLTALKFGLTTKGIGRIGELSSEKKTKVLWLMNQMPLLVEVDDSKKDQIDAIILLLGRCKQKKKLILIGYSTQGDFTNWKVFRDLSDISEDDSLRRLKCSLQGKEATTLKDLIHDTKTASTFRVDQLLEIATNDNFNIGESLELLPSIYIPRSFYKVLLNYKVIDTLSDSRTFLSYNSKKDVAQSKFNTRSVDVSDCGTENFINYKIFTCDSEFEGEKITKEFLSDSPSHHLRVVDGQNLQWLNSNRGIEELEGFKKFSSSQVVSENEIEDHFQSKIKILTSHTGTGKTTFLDRIKNQSPPNYFVIKMNLKDHVEYFRREQSQPWSYIVEFTARTRIYDSFESELLRNCEKKKIIVLWDSLDELPSESVDRFVETVKALRSDGICQWIAAQNRFQAFLERTFGVFVLTMLPFSQEEQIFYIQNQCRVSDDHLMNSFIENMKIIDNYEYLGLPLQLYILSEIFSESELLDKIYTLTDMLAAFIDGKYNHYLERNTDFKDSRRLRNLFEDAKNHRLDQYRIAAVKTYMPELYQQLGFKNTKKFLDEMKEGDFLGLIERVDCENFVFEHQIFGEFLNATYLATNLPTGLDQFIFKDEFRTIRFMFDLLLAENQPNFVAILYKKYDHVGCDVVKDKGGRSPLHLICSYGMKHPSLQDEHCEESNQYILGINANALCEESEDIRSTVNRLCKVYSSSEKDSLFQWTCVDYADRSCSLGLLDCLEGVGPKSLSYGLGTILYYSVRFNYSNLFTSIKELPYVEDNNRNNLIHVATEFNRDKCLSRLLSQEVYRTSINKLNDDDWSPLHIATFNGNLPLIKFLLNKGATFILRQPSVMSLAVTIGRKDIVEFFLQCGCSPNEFYHSNHFTTSIFQAIHQKHDAIVELLLRNGAKLYCINRPTPEDTKPNPFGMNLFHMVLENEQFEEAEMVLKKGIHIDSVDNDGRTAFHHAACNNQERVVRYLLAKGGNPRLLDKKGQSSLHCAAHGGSVEVAKILLEEGLGTNLQDSEGLTPLHTAVLTGNTNFVSFFVERVDPNIANKHGRTSLHLAAIFDLSECMEHLHRHGGDLEARDGLYGRTPLHLAAWNGNEQCVKFLLDKGTPVDTSCNFGFTPLHLAIEEANMESCQLLLKAGASVSTLNRNGSTPLDLIRNGYLHLNRLLVPFTPTPLHSAVERGDLEFVKELLSLDFDANAVASGGNTPLHVAVRCQKALGVVETLLGRGGDVTKVNDDGLTPLHYALRDDFLDKRVVEVLLEADATNSTVNRATVKGTTPLHIATQHAFTQFEAIVKLLLEKGARTDATDDLGFTPLHYASSSGNLQIVTSLVNRDSDVNRRSNSGRTPLHLAATRKHLNVVNYLLKHHALILEDSSGDSPLHDALKAEESQIFKLLYDQNRSFDVSTSYMGRTILHVASKNGPLDLVNFFLDKVVIDGVDFEGSTALEEALYNRNYDIFHYLLRLIKFEVNKFNKRYGKYPLHVVTSSGNKLLVEYFLKQGARVDVIDDDGNTPLHIASDCKQTEIFLLLLSHDSKAADVKNKKGETVLHKLIDKDAAELVKILLDKGVDVDLTDKHGNTPFDLCFHCGKLMYTDVLFRMKSFDVHKHSRCCQQTLLHLAVYSESVDTIQWLHQKGASINSEDEDGDSPLHYAIGTNLKIFNLLLEKWKSSIDLEKSNNEGETVLHLAAESSPEMVERLLKLGASPHATTKYGATPLFYALKNPKCFKILWKKTPEVEIFNVTGHMARTVLHYAASRGDLHSTKFFLEVGLKINEPDNEGKTPLYGAASEGHLRVLEVLLKKDMDHRFVNLCRGHGYSLLHLAASARRFNLVKLLVRFKGVASLCNSDGETAADIALKNGDVEMAEFLKKHENGYQKF